MDKKTIDNIVWWIPFRKLRNAVREYYNTLLNIELKLNALNQNFEIKDYDNNSNNSVRKIIDLISYTKNFDTQKRILKDNLNLIEIEIGSFCNRKCWFCPNNFIDRHSSNAVLDEIVFEKIIIDLKKIDYSENISFHRFNEPLYDKELILKRVSFARKNLPKAKLQIFTNGDYLTADYMDELANAGITLIIISQYLDKEDKYDIELVKQKIDKIAEKLMLDYKIISSDENEYSVKFNYEKINTICRTKNFDTIGSNRGGTIKEIKHELRSIPCFFPYKDIYVDYNGFVMPCCNLRSDVDNHKRFILGNVKNNSIFEIFTNAKTTKLRKELAINIDNIPQCNTCNYIKEL